MTKNDIPRTIMKLQKRMIQKFPLMIVSPRLLQKKISTMMTLRILYLSFQKDSMKKPQMTHLITLKQTSNNLETFPYSISTLYYVQGFKYFTCKFCFTSTVGLKLVSKDGGFRSAVSSSSGKTGSGTSVGRI